MLGAMDASARREPATPKSPGTSNAALLALALLAGCGGKAPGPDGPNVLWIVCAATNSAPSARRERATRRRPFAPHRGDRAREHASGHFDHRVTASGRDELTELAEEGLLDGAHLVVASYGSRAEEVRDWVGSVCRSYTPVYGEDPAEVAKAIRGQSS